MNNYETRSQYYTARKIIFYRNILLCLNSPQRGPTPIFGDNKATIVQVRRDRLTPRIRHINLLVTWMNEQFAREKIASVYNDTNIIKLTKIQNHTVEKLFNQSTCIL